MKQLISLHSFSFLDAPAAFKSVKEGKGPDGKMAIKVVSKYLQIRKHYKRPVLTYRQLMDLKHENRVRKAV